MEALYLDTHIVVWLRQKELQKFSPKALEAIEQAGQLFISPMVELELKFLYEIGRISETSYNILGDLGAMIGLKIDDHSFSEVIQKAMLIDWTRDPFDRIIVAHAMSQERKLLTKDEKILNYFHDAVW
ncbi:type II toxin-antitoxin system VapC family toxin [Sulfurospirillum multivorans]|uniref:Nuclease n=2 Tax=Sulfurospirillum multivorans TaxID=66821 RepID=A0AA86AKR8_SULMK|nr:PIN domain-containing protein [Sulfurospirillum multivorans]AHJ12501.1 putative nuclease [Sulfurospirillum multivorans DSM 12446]QEH05996.1 putative nuclease [Sulfurospirillum multivorans]